MKTIFLAWSFAFFCHTAGACHLNNFIGVYKSANTAIHLVHDGNQYDFLCELKLTITSKNSTDLQIDPFSCKDAGGMGVNSSVGPIKVDGNKLLILNLKTKTFDQVGSCTDTSISITTAPESPYVLPAGNGLKINLSKRPSGLVFRGDFPSLPDPMWFDGSATFN